MGNVGNRLSEANMPMKEEFYYKINLACHMLMIKIHTQVVQGGVFLLVLSKCQLLNNLLNFLVEGAEVWSCSECCLGSVQTPGVNVKVSLLRGAISKPEICLAWSH